jgi:hypothetical protein
LVQITKNALNNSTNFNIDLFIFFATIVGYNFLKYFEVFQNKVFTIKKNYAISLVSFFAFLGLLYYFLKLEFDLKLAFLKIVVLVLIYPFLRKYGFLKMFIVAFCVTYITVYIPILNENWIKNYNYLLQRFLIIISLLIPFEIIDVEKDAKTITTLPQKIGIQNTKLLGYVLLFICIIFLHLNLLIAFIIGITIFFSSSNRSQYYTSFWVESVPIFWWFIIYLIEK